MSTLYDIHDKPIPMYFSNPHQDYEIHNSTIGGMDEDTLFEIKLMVGTLTFCSFFVQCSHAFEICSKIDNYIQKWRINRNLKEHLIQPESIYSGNLISSREECSICLESYQEKDKIVQLTCNHIFHKDCIGEWLQNKQNNCPLCRFPL